MNQNVSGVFVNEKERGKKYSRGIKHLQEALQLMKDLGMISVDTEPGSVG